MKYVVMITFALHTIKLSNVLIARYLSTGVETVTVRAHVFVALHGLLNVNILNNDDDDDLGTADCLILFSSTMHHQSSSW